jgi:predicted nucleotide-binding protein
MNSPSQELLTIAERLDQARAYIDLPEVKEVLRRIDEVAEQVGKSWSGSWLGYHSRVYYAGLRPPPPGSHFNPEWGLMRPAGGQITNHWAEFDFDAIVNTILQSAGRPDLAPLQKLAKAAEDIVDDSRHETLSVLSTSEEHKGDLLIADLREQTDSVRIFSASDYVNYLRPQGQLASRDSTALYQGLQVPPHLSVLADVMSIRSPAQACQKLSKIARRSASHLARRESQPTGGSMRVFIGHGRSAAWRDLKDFLQDRLHLPWDEFNRVPVAGITNIQRLSQMLDDAGIAFLVLTAEDEQVDGRTHARLNVVHEAGLFQGRLGFTKAILLLEEGCEEFSNVHGLGQIRFQADRISGAFEAVRQVLEREGMISDEKR